MPPPAHSSYKIIVAHRLCIAAVCPRRPLNVEEHTEVDISNRLIAGKYDRPFDRTLGNNKCVRHQTDKLTPFRDISYGLSLRRVRAVRIGHAVRQPF